MSGVLGKRVKMLYIVRVRFIETIMFKCTFLIVKLSRCNDYILKVFNLSNKNDIIFYELCGLPEIIQTFKTIYTFKPRG